MFQLKLINTFLVSLYKTLNIYIITGYPNEYGARESKVVLQV